TRDITSDARMRPEIVVTPSRDIASLFGVDSAQIVNSVNYALDGVKIDEVYFGGDEEIDVRLRNLWTSRDQVRDLADLPLRSPTGKVAMLEQVADIDRTHQANVLHRYDRSRAITLRGELRDGVLADDIKAKLVKI